MRIAFPNSSMALVAFLFVICGLTAAGQNTQTPAPPQPASQSQAHSQSTKQASPGGEVGHGAGDFGKGTARGAGAAAKGVGKGAGDLVTLHPIDAASNLGKGAVGAGKDIGVGAGRGTGKIVKGTGRGIGKLFHHHHDRQMAEPQN